MSVEVTETGLNLIPAGYKQTEVGVIPEDWEIFSLGQSIAKTQLGGNYKNSEHDTGQPLIKMGNLDRGFVKLSKQEFIIGNASESDLLNYGDVLFNTRNTLELVGKVAIWKNELPKAYFNSNLMRISFKEDLVSSNLFMNALMNSERFIKALSDIAIGTTSVAAIYNRDLFLIKVALPTKKEQTAIANALSDVDALISKLENLIAKKQAIKTATMQQLLTGRTRLPQFALREDGSKKSTKKSELGEIPEDWEVVNIGDLGQVDPENLGSTTSPDYEFNYVSLEQIEKGVLVGTTRTIFRNAPSRARRVLKKGDILVSTVRPNLMSHYFVQHEVNDLICSTGFSVIRFFEEKLCPGYLYQHLFSSVINNQIEMLISGSNYPAINSGDVKQLKVQIGSVEEQTAIATILSDMDKEIQALKQRLSKTYQIKQGMMQELLTGKTRLIKPSKEVIHE
ncbi:restriction endonuclease subunit S [Morganella morganii]|uniref:restriction endonuclease subunit S n=1 Tax=Morganella morganii TaxID=582 RepID=UPI0032DA47F8